MIGTVERMTAMPAKKQRRPRLTTTTRSLLPSCHPHCKVGIAFEKTMNGGPRMTRGNDGTTSPIKRIYFYHMRKAGSTMICKYLRKVASRYQIHLLVLEYKHAHQQGGGGEPSQHLLRHQPAQSFQGISESLQVRCTVGVQTAHPELFGFCANVAQCPAI